MGSSFTAWKVAIILFCCAAFGLTLIGWQALSAFGDQGRSYLDDLVNDRVTWSFRYNEDEGSRFSTLRRVVVHGQDLMVETVDDEAGIKQGLSDRRSMHNDEGLLFVMPNVDIHTFWMYHMLFPIDMVWLRDGVIVEIAPNMPPPSETAGIPKTYTPEALADMVLELTAGGAERYGMKVGDKLDF
ncbi:DUF192 domain-containing protein [Candidatus Uhrbacteria bacterium]|nr:DUF192 domain-containing protein [Candidatus Uhrbacteria bacterium]